MKIEEHHRTIFATEGLLPLRNLIPKTKTEPARDLIFKELARLGLRENGKWHLKKFNGIPSFQLSTRIAQRLRHHKEFDEVIQAEVITCLSALAACELSPALPHVQILVTPPQKEVWVLPKTGWHVDIARPESDALPGIQVFVLLDNIAPSGGATLAIRGSHKSRDRVPEPERVFEMCGKAGDVFLMDMRVLHAPSINASKHARMMLTNRYLCAQ